jgi:hypothetical protein
MLPLTVEVRATASCLDVWPTKSSFTLYPASDPLVTVQLPARPLLVVAVVVGVGVDRTSVVGVERRPEKK